MYAPAHTSARRVALALLAWLAFAAGCASAPVARPDGPEIDALTFKGNRALSDNRIRAKILTAETSWLPFSEKHYLDEGVLELDLRRILRLYEAHGYYQARVVERTVTPVGRDEVEILIRIDEGEPALVASFSVSGLEALSKKEQRALLAELPLSEGAPIAEAKYDTTKRRLAERLREQGFAEAEVEGKVEVAIAERRAEVALRVETGPRYAFGGIFIAGTHIVPRAKVRQEVTEELRTGERYSDSALIRAEARLVDMGVFSSAKVTRGEPDRERALIPVVVSVREAPFRTLRLGAGFGIDPARYELPRATAVWTNRNFFGGLRKLTLSSEVALVFLDIAQLDDPDQRGTALALSAALEQPDAIARNVALTTSLGYEHGFESTYSSDAITGSVGLIWRLARTVTFVPSYNLSIFALSPESNLSDAILAGGQGAVLDKCAQDRSLCLLAWLEQRLSWDRRDNPIAPTRGSLLSLSVQEGSSAIGGGYDYLRFLPEARYYQPLGAHVLAARAMAGMLLPAEGSDSSVLTRFYLGGSTTQRGFGNRNLSPQVVVPEVDTQVADRPWAARMLPVGGNGMMAGNLEMRWALPANFGFVTFLDAGSVTTSAEELSSSGLHLAAGVGARYRTLFGPVRLDVAWRLNKLGGEISPGVLIATPPGTALSDFRPLTLSRFAIHFSIGEAF